MESINKRTKNLTLISILALLTYTLEAQTRIDVGLNFSPTISTFNTAGKTDHFKHIFALNYGLTTSIKKGSFIFSTGIHNIMQGAKFEVLHTTTDNPEGTGDYYDLIIRARTIMVPINVAYVFKATKKTEFFGGFGFYTGYIYSQQQENTSIPKGHKQDSTVIYPYPQERTTDVDLFDQLYFGINAGMGFRHFFNEKISLQVNPNFLFQLRKELPANQHAYTNRLMSFSLDIGLFYTFGS